MVESILDALMLMSQTEGYVAVATGGTMTARTDIAVAEMQRAEIVLLAFDSDEGGEETMQWWTDALGEKAVPRQVDGDPGEMFAAGVNLQHWLDTGEV